MRIVSLIDEEDVIERASCAISGFWQEGCACIPAPTRRAKRPFDRWLDDPCPDYTPNSAT